MLQGLKWLISQIRKALLDDLITVYASQASFYIIIAAVPFAILLLSLMQFLLPLNSAGLVTAIKSFLPKKMHYVAETAILQLYMRSGSVISLSAVTSVWTASRGVAAVSRGIRQVYNIPAPTFVKAFSKDALNTLLLLFILLLSLVILLFGSSGAELLAESIEINQAIINLLGGLRIIVFLVIQTLIFASIYRMISGKAMPFKTHLCGAAFSSLGWVMFSLGYEFYIENFSNYSYIYGSLAAVVLLMLWLYFCMIIFLFGAEINKFINNRGATDK